MKQFILFAGDCYYPGGGMADYIGDFHNLIDAQIYQRPTCDWWHILDTETGLVHEMNREGEWVAKPFKEWVII